MVEPSGVAGVAVDVFGGLGAGRHVQTRQLRVFMIEQPLFRVPAAQDDGAGVPGVVLQVPVFIGPHDVVHAERPRAPPQRRFVRLAGVGVEQPPATHVHIGAVSGHDVQVRGALGAGDEPGGNRRARKQLGDQAPEQIDHGESLPGHARAVEEVG